MSDMSSMSSKGALRAAALSQDLGFNWYVTAGREEDEGWELTYSGYSSLNSSSAAFCNCSHFPGHVGIKLI